MAFCKYCGKELQKGEACDCKQAKAILGVSADKNNKKATVPITVKTTDASEKIDTSALKEKIFNKKVMVIGGIILTVIIVFLIFFIFNHIGARGAARKYAKNLYDNKGGKTYYSMLLPDDLYKSLKGDKLDAMVDEFNDENKETNADYKIKFKGIDKIKKLSSRQLNGAEKYFAYFAGKYDKTYRTKSFSAKKGYVYEITYKIKDRQSGETKNYTKEIAVVKFSGEGWKILDKELSDDQSFSDYLESLDSGNANAEKFGF
jgi:hypothetical protein